ncbi:hypothetical protein H0I31_03920 [Tenacibaculum sp. AHE15PA]|uniref:hypothetical protein n=1 Tax=unclassified Tenacibaculum TaxID=2635139 RepID=UPI001C4E667D|nr:MULTISPECIES: hypothetical protein [unclassified Tenacibaculum]QXP72856.1 hypothetical protein H0I30_09180 [Tenacibaculum sp. AHE14PA]QXP76770.1 hypothetical protein H0I31_03920 [Tenacibaculum sp. AHE15PA]
MFANLTFFAQEKLLKKSTFQSEEIEIITDGLDDVTIENSLSNQIEVVLLDENPNTHTIFINEQSGVLKVSFKLNFNIFKEPVFRKYITQRLQRATTIIKIPNHKTVNIYGKTIDITSKDYKGDLKIYIDNGNVKLNEIKGNTAVKLFSGNVYGRIKKATAINIETNNGEIHVNKNNYNKQFYSKSNPKAIRKLNVRSINANVILITE